MEPQENSEVGSSLSFEARFIDLLWIILSASASFVIFLFLITCVRVLILGQKTRSPQPRRMYVGSRARPSLGHQEPTIYVSPSNLPPPPKYEAMAPPSYEEVVGVHYPSFNIQPITQPINTALSNVQSSSNATSNETNNVPSTVINEHGDAPVSIAVSRT